MQIHDLKRVRAALDAADLVLIGASNGLDMAEGLNLFAPDAHFRNAYADLAQISGARSILEGFYLSHGDLAQRWAWQARFACREWLDYEPGPVLRPLHAFVADKSHFVITCNLNARFARAGFNPQLVLETEGSVSQLSCSAACCDELHPAASAMRALNASIAAGSVAPSLVPRCPQCGAPLTCAIDERRLQHPDVQLTQQLKTLQELLARHHGRNIVVLELGVGLRNGVIKQLLAHAVRSEPSLTYAVFNYSQVVFPQGLEQHCIGIPGNMAAAFQAMETLS
ncbi:MAG: hypothetical protein Q4B54_05000 [Coriobacteriales bacterium]|nr:hypothetical protein [Coriobacteriales bacterium]